MLRWFELISKDNKIRVEYIDNLLNFSVSRYDTYDIYKANHYDEITKRIFECIY